MNYSAKKHLTTEVSELTEQLGEVKEAMEKMQEAEPADGEASAETNTSAQELDALKAAFSNGVVLQDMELLYKAQKALTPERQVGMASVRLLTKGPQDEGTIAAFQKALEMAEWSNRLQTVCAAQNALAAAGQKVTVLSDCKKSFNKDNTAAKDADNKDSANKDTTTKDTTNETNDGAVKGNPSKSTGGKDGSGKKDDKM